MAQQEPSPAKFLAPVESEAGGQGGRSHREGWGSGWLSWGPHMDLEPPFRVLECGEGSDARREVVEGFVDIGTRGWPSASTVKSQSLADTRRGPA